MNDSLLKVIQALQELEEDSSIPKNLKLKISNTIGLLRAESEVSIKVNKALNELEEIAEDVNMQPFTRSQIFNIVSLLEVV